MLNLTLILNLILVMTLTFKTGGKPADILPDVLGHKMDAPTVIDYTYL